MTVYLLVYVDDIILIALSTTALTGFISALHMEFDLKDIGSLHYFLGVSVHQTRSGFFLSQRKYAEEILDRAAFSNCKPCSTPVDTSTKLSLDVSTGHSVDDPTLFRSLAGALQYLTFTWPDISYAVQQICLFMHEPRAPHLTALKRILRYLKGTLDYGLSRTASSDLSLTAYSDADCGGCSDTRRSTSGYCVFLGSSLVSWSSK